MNRAVFLDRDGVINRAVIRSGKPHAPERLDEFELLSGVSEALDALHGGGYLLIVTTNQPDVGAGRIPGPVVETIHRHLRDTLPLDDVRVCYHTDADACSCRKPKPGMLTDAARDWDIDLSSSVMVGDRWRDVGAGKAAGCRTVLVESGYDERAAEGHDAAVSSLLEATRLILSGRFLAKTEG